MSNHLRNYQMEAEQHRNECEGLRLTVAQLKCEVRAREMEELFLKETIEKWKDECWRLRANLINAGKAENGAENKYRKALEEIAEGHYGEASGKEYPNAWKLAKRALEAQDE